MKKIALLTLLAALGACDSEKIVPKERTPFETISYRIVGEDSIISILKDNETGCQYIWTNGGLVKRYDPYGKATPKCPDGIAGKSIPEPGISKVN